MYKRLFALVALMLIALLIGLLMPLPQAALAQFGTATPTPITYSLTPTVTPAIYTFPVDAPDYFPNTGVTPVSPPPQFATNATVASVDVYRLNVRSAPSTNGVVLTIIEYGEIYPIVQVSEDGGWYLLQIGNLRGWVSAPLVIAANAEDVPSLQDFREQAVQETVDRFLATTFNTVVTTGNLNMRSGPGTNFPIVWRMPAGARAALVGRDAYGTWWQVDFGGLIGWVSGAYLVFSTNTNLALIPVR